FADNPANADDELRSLVNATHRVGLYVILDIVFNHTGNAFAYVCDAGEKSCADSGGAQADFRNSARPILWRDGAGTALSPHGDATRFFVTFLDNHDVKERIRYVQPGDEHKYDDQVTLGIALLYCPPGIPASTMEPNRDCMAWVMTKPYAKLWGAD